MKVGLIFFDWLIESGQSAISGKLIKKRGVGLLDLGVLNCKY